MRSMKPLSDIDSYIAAQPAGVQKLLKTMRAAIKKAAPKAQEKIGYGIPTFTLNGNLVHFGAFKAHLGFFPTPLAIDAFKDELKGYEISKGTIKFPYEDPLPLDLVTKIVKFRVAQQEAKKATKK